MDVLYLDFAKAFDKVPHQRLIHKLAQYGIQNKMLNWIKAFLSNRRQRVVLGDSISSWTHVSSGVPQGSVLGPTLFIIYINDLPDKLINPNEIYADDTKIFCKINKNNFESDSKKLQTDINYIVDWTCIWLMRLNTTKCKIMHIGKSNPMKTYYMVDHESGLTFNLEPTLSERDLGIQMTSDLKFSEQTNIAVSKANRMIGLMKHTFSSSSIKIWKKLYTTYITQNSAPKRRSNSKI